MCNISCYGLFIMSLSKKHKVDSEYGIFQENGQMNIFVSMNRTAVLKEYNIARHCFKQTCNYVTHISEQRHGLNLTQFQIRKLRFFHFNSLK
jgi:hypothetical protein